MNSTSLIQGSPRVQIDSKSILAELSGQHIDASVPPKGCGEMLSWAIPVLPARLYAFGVLNSGYRFHTITVLNERSRLQSWASSASPIEDIQGEGKSR